MEGEAEAATVPSEAREGQDSSGPAASAHPPPGTRETACAAQACAARPASEIAQGARAESVQKMANRKDGRKRRPQIPRIDLKSEREIEQTLNDLRIVGDGRVVGRAMLAMFYCQTTNADKIAKATGLNREFCRTIYRRLRENKVITATGRLHVEWFHEDPVKANLAFAVDTLVAEGTACRGEPVDGRPTYRATSLLLGESVPGGERGAAKA